jgi:formate hydrogenlyase subunit 3/multisubunit Na+/H+ antiporter MnhD subunit
VDERVNAYLTYGALLTALFGAFATLAPGRLRRRLGYAMVSDIGFVLAGIATYTRIGVAGAVLHLAHRSLVALVLAAAASELQPVEGEGERCSASAPYLWGALLLGVLGLLTLPPLSGFAASWAIFQAVSLAGWRAALVLALASVICFGALLSGLGGIRRAYSWPWRRPRVSEAYLLALAAFTVLWGLVPAPYLGAIHSAVSQLTFLKPF